MFYGTNLQILAVLMFAAVLVAAFILVLRSRTKLRHMRNRLREKYGIEACAMMKDDVMGVSGSVRKLRTVGKGETRSHG